MALFAGAAPAQKVSLDTGKTLQVLSKAHLGIGVAVWDAHMIDPVIPGLIRDAGFKVIRYPGGSYADLYHWQTGKATAGMEATIKPNTDFDSFMKLSRASRTTPLITVNYGSNPEGTGPAEPSEAADWVRYANVQHRWNVKYWEIGNEIYGNGFYNGSAWEVDLHIPEAGKGPKRLKNPLLGPTTYGKRVKEFALAMKAVDPSIKVGAVAAMGGWPEAVEPDWTSTMLKECGDVVDFVVIHWYGSGKTPQELFSSLKNVPATCARTRAKIAEACGQRSKDVQIWMTEGDSGGFGMQYAGGLFAVDHLLTWWGAGAEHVNWWNLHNGPGLNEQKQPDDQGVLSSGGAEHGYVQPPANTPFDTYYGLKLVGSHLSPGDRLVATSGSVDNLASYGFVKADGRRGMFLVNHSPSASATFEVDLGSAPVQRVDLVNRSGAKLIPSRIRAKTRLYQATLEPFSACVLLTGPIKKKSR